MKWLHIIAIILVIVGALNWLLVGLIGWDIGALFGGMTAMISRAIYILVGLAGIYMIFTHKSSCRECSAGASGSTGGAM